ncbi:MAG: DUF4331 family protein [Candidatus Eremiobacteraeota bacterium]|nr:DUF4331 family protein [Candidatus Eremiobacteraeota bacterium]
MRNRFTYSLVAAALAGIVVGGCSSGVGSKLVPGLFDSAARTSVAQSSSTAYKQIELLARPAVKEAFETFADHSKTDRAEPYNDNLLKSQIGSFTENFRSSTIAGALQSVLYPNEMLVDLSQNTTTAAYLGVESGGATGSKFGGRALDDDIITDSLGAIFGDTLTYLGVADDHKELPCLTTDNVSYQSKSTKTFPYIEKPR